MSNPTPRADALLVDIRQAAALLGVSPRTVWTLTHDGELPAVRIGRRVLYDVADLKAFIDARKDTSGRAAPSGPLTQPEDARR